MDFINYVNNIPNITVAKRLASVYVADYRRLEIDELKEFLIKTGTIILAVSIGVWILSNFGFNIVMCII